MNNIITEEIRLRKKIVEYAIKHNNNAKAARRYHTSRQQVSRWRTRFDGTFESLMPKSRRPHSHPKAHKKEEIDIIKHCYKRYKIDGLAEVYVQCMKRGYKRSYTSLLKVIKNHCKQNKEVKKLKYPKSNWEPEKVTYPGEKVQIDIKYVPQICIGWDSKGVKYYQITAIDEYSRKRVCKIVEEKSVTETAKFMMVLEEEFDFKIKSVQTDNGREFTNDPQNNERTSIFEKVLKYKGIIYKKTRPYSPWQNGKVERSHREDSEKFYNRVFNSKEELIKKHKRYIKRKNNCAKKILNFKSPNEVVRAYFAVVA